MNSTPGANPASNTLGLSAQEAAASRAQHGANVLTPPLRKPWWTLYLQKFNDPVIRILIVAAGIAIAAGAFDGAYIEGLGILCAIILSTALAFLNEYKAAREFDLLDRSSDDIPVRVVRDGRNMSIPRRDVVVGDVAFFEAGQEIAADGNLIESVNLLIDESRMTGESEPVEKSAQGVTHDSPASTDSQKNPVSRAYAAYRLLRGTIVADGYGKICVTEVGDKTEAGRSARAATEDDTEKTPLDKQLDKLARFIGIAGFAAAAFLLITLTVRGSMRSELRLSSEQWRFALLIVTSSAIAAVRIWLPIVFDALEFSGRNIARPSWLESKNWRDRAAPIIAALGFFGITYYVFNYFELMPMAPEVSMPPKYAREFLRIFMIAVTVVVVAVPEGLAMSVTLCLAYSVRRMAATNNLVRHMHACETIGAATVICSDKTGTLTMNEMRVFEADFPLLDPEIRKHRATLLLERKPANTPLPVDSGGAARNLVFQSIVANSTADLSARSEERRVLGNPTEGALLLWIENQGIDYNTLRKQNQIVDRLPFSTGHKFMCSLVSPSPNQRSILHVKGAPEVVLARCTKVLTEVGPEPISHWRRALDSKLRDYQSRGMRTLGFAFKDGGSDAATGTDLLERSKDLIWLGFVAIQDPVRAEAPEAIRACQHAGISVKIVTGDNVETACEIARQVGLWGQNESSEALVQGPVFATMSDAVARTAALRLKILARSSPHDKLRLVKLLKGVGQVVAVTGDGANDAPALNFASVGLSMGKTGTASAREASDIVLLDDSFNSIVSAIKWGRSLYDNIQRFIVFQLTINAAALGLMLMGPFIGVKLPLTVPQMLWINIIMDTLAALALASEPPHNSVMERKPRAANAFIITRDMAADIGLTAAFFLSALLALITVYKRDGEFDRRESTIVFTVLVLLQFWNLFNARCFGRTASAFHGIAKNRGLLAVAGIILLGQIFIVQFGGALFRTEPLNVLEWAAILFATSLVLCIGEFRRWLKRLQLIPESGARPQRAPQSAR